jgi:hypothetical protein
MALLEAVLFALLDVLFNSLFTARQWTYNINFAQIKSDNGPESPGSFQDIRNLGQSLTKFDNRSEFSGQILYLTTLW